MPVRLSYSTLELLHKCERLFQLNKLLDNGQREESEHLSFGAGFGMGVASYLAYQDKEKAQFDAWMAYYPVVETDKKNQARMFVALEKAFFALDSLLDDYELVQFQGRPATELSFRMDINEDYYFVGYIDAVLRNRYTGQYVVFEVKTTGMLLKDLTPLYKHSGQALGYSITLDRIVGHDLSSYGVLYFVAQLGKDQEDVTIHIFPFSKTLLDRLNWFITLGLDVKHLQEMESLNIYPRRGGSCLMYNRACSQFGTCHLHSLDRPKVEEPDVVEYQFQYQLEDMITDHLRRIEETPSIGDLEPLVVEGEAEDVEAEEITEEDTTEQEEPADDLYKNDPLGRLLARF